MTDSLVQNPTKSSHSVHVTRDAQVALIQTYFFNNFEKLFKDAGLSKPSTEALFADLSCGPWSSHWLVKQICSQLDIAAPKTMQPNLFRAIRTADEYADIVSQLIDAEASGDSNFSIAYDMAIQITEQISINGIKYVFIVAPQADHMWGAENVKFLKILNFAALQYGFKLWCLAPIDQLPQPVDGIHWVQVNCVGTKVEVENNRVGIPGLVKQEWLNTLRLAPPCIAAPDGNLLVSPNYRSVKLDDAQIKCLLSLEVPEWLRIYLELQSTRQNIAWLIAASGQCFAEGGYEVALTILDALNVRYFSHLQRAQLELQKQRILIAQMKFQRAAQGMLPHETVPNGIKASLWQSKGWAFAMTGRALEACECFEQAYSYFKLAYMPRLELYLLNIWALAKVESGDIKGALKLEKKIEASLQTMPKRDWHMLYINNLNLARVYKKNNDLENSSLYYDRAFSVTTGLRNESDLLFVNVCKAQLLKLQGDNTGSFQSWLRAALHWLSNPKPEALAPRVGCALMGRHLSDCEIDVEEISSKLLEALVDAARENGVSFQLSEAAISFSRLETEGQAEFCLSGKGWAIGLSGQPVPAVWHGVSYELLQLTVVGILNSEFPQVDFSMIKSIVTDARYGHELPLNVRDAFLSCWRYKISMLRHSEGVITISDLEGEKLSTYQVALASGVASIVNDAGHMYVYFKRYLHQVILNNIEIEIIRHIHDNISIKQLSELLGKSIYECMFLLRGMEVKRIVVIK